MASAFSRLTSPTARFVVVLLLLAVGISLVIVEISPMIGLFLLLAGVGAVLVALKPEWFIYSVLFVRPLLEIFREDELFAGLNMAGLFTVAYVGVAIFLLLRSRRFEIDTLSIFFLGFLFVSAISVILSKNVIQGFGEWLRHLSFLLIYLTTKEYLVTEAQKRSLLLVLSLSAVLPVLWDLVLIYQQTGWVDQGVIRFGSFFAHVNNYGIFTALISIIVLAILLNSQVFKVNRFVFAGLFLLCCFTVLKTYARVAWGCLALGVGIFALFWNKKLLVPMALGVILVVLLDPGFLLRWDLLSTHTVEENSMLSRFEMWGAAWNLFEQNPVIGIGLRSFDLYLPSLLGNFYQGIDFVVFHNAYLQILTETGVLGIAFYALTYFELVKSAFVHLKLWRSGLNGVLAITLFALCLAFLSTGLSDNVASSPLFGWPLWSMAALLAQTSFKKESVRENCIG